MYGYEDRYIHPIARGTDFLAANHRQQKFWPVHVIDVGHALEIIAYDDATNSETYELYGPRQYSKAQIAHLISKMTLNDRKYINLPRPVMEVVATLLNKIWWPTYSKDEVVREFIDQKIDPTAKTFKDLGITPVELDAVLFQYVRNYRLVDFYVRSTMWRALTFAAEKTLTSTSRP
jgi:NADH dehydrogenase (ubiquinone) 1 alpha subcomplex subunit 9